MAEYQLVAAGGVKRGGAFIPDDDGNKDWRAYQAWLTGGGVPDAAVTLTLAEYQARARVEVDRQAEAERLAHVSAGSGQAEVDLERYLEADAAAVDGSITAGEYELLEAEIPEHGADVAAVATYVQAERAARKTALAAIEDVRVTAHSDIDAAANEAAVDAVVAAVSWPV